MYENKNERELKKGSLFFIRDNLQGFTEKTHSHLIFITNSK